MTMTSARTRRGYFVGWQTSLPEETAERKTVRMRAPAAIVVLFVAATAFGQNTDIEALAGLQFNFGNPGARSLGMGGAFIGLADDASAAEANPAGLTILRKTEVSLEARQTSLAQRFVTGGTFPFVTSQEFATHEKSISFASVVIPTNAGVLAFYYHRPLAFRSAVDLTGRYATPSFFLGAGGPMSAEECATDPTCQQHRIYPFSTSVDLQMETYGVALAREWRTLSFGGAARYHRFSELARTMRRDIDAAGQPAFSVQQANGGRSVGSATDKDVTFVGGVRWAPLRQFSIGAVYKEGASFPAPVSAQMSGGPMEVIGLTEFHVPSAFGAGVTYRPFTSLTMNADAVRVKYSHLTDNFLSVIEFGTEDAGGVERLSGYRAVDGTELHAGLEYFVLARVPFAIRTGWWRDPAHSIRYEAPLDTPHAVAAQILFPRGDDENHYSVGIGVAFPKFQLDAAYDHSRTVKTASVSLIARY
jgi:long-chain fatty acid transport protein